MLYTVWDLKGNHVHDTRQMLYLLEEEHKDRDRCKLIEKGPDVPLGRFESVSVFARVLMTELHASWRESYEATATFSQGYLVVSLTVASVTMPRVPSAPMNSCLRSYPVLSFRRVVS